MKRLLKLLFVVLVAFCFIPFVHAAEDVTYFLSYPDGTEDVKTTKAEADAVKEILLFEGRTGSNGRVYLNDWNNSGKIRIVQEIPNGYTTNTREITVDLADASNGVKFINYRGLSNPSTGRTLFYVIIVIGVIGMTVLVTLWNKKVANLVLIIAIGVFAFTKVNAWTENFAIEVLDGSGKPIPNVLIKVYGTAEVDASPAIKLDANGGVFFDDMEIMWVKLPENGCSGSALFDAYPSSQREYYNANIVGAYREGYRFSVSAYENNILNKTHLNNGDVYKIDWTADASKHLITFVGNGGYFPFYGQKLSNVTFYIDSDIWNDETVFNFINDDGYFVGEADDRTKCSRYRNGINTSDESIDFVGEDDNQIVHLCWDSRPDGIYINDRVFIGNNSTQSCFRESDPLFDVGLSSFINFYTNDRLDMIDTGNAIGFKFYPENGAPARIQSFEIVKNGESVAFVDQNNLSLQGGNVEEGYYIIAEGTPRTAFNNYYGEFVNNCSQ